LRRRRLTRRDRVDARTRSGMQARTWSVGMESGLCTQAVHSHPNWERRFMPSRPFLSLCRRARRMSAAPLVCRGRGSRSLASTTARREVAGSPPHPQSTTGSPSDGIALALAASPRPALAASPCPALCPSLAPRLALPSRESSVSDEAWWSCREALVHYSCRRRPALARYIYATCVSCHNMVYAGRTLGTPFADLPSIACCPQHASATPGALASPHATHPPPPQGKQAFTQR